jgi:hypothetical protein
MFAYEVTTNDIQLALVSMGRDTTEAEAISNRLDFAAIEKAALSETDFDAQVVAAYAEIKEWIKSHKPCPLETERTAILLNEGKKLTKGETQYLDKVTSVSSGNLCTLIKTSNSLPSFGAHTEKMQRVISHLWKNYTLNMMMDSETLFKDWVDCWESFNRALPSPAEDKEFTIQIADYVDLSTDRTISVVLFVEHEPNEHMGIITYNALTGENILAHYRIPSSVAKLDKESTLEIDCEDFESIKANYPNLFAQVDL